MPRLPYETREPNAPKGLVEMNAVLDCIRDRRSVRSYKPDAVADSELQAVLEAALYAPSAANQQPWHFTVIRSREVLDAMNRDTKEHFKSSEVPHFRRFAESEQFNVFHNAPLAIIVSGDERAMLPAVDCAAATENILIAAESLGLASCWINAAIHLFQGAKAAEWLGRLGIPEGFRPMYAVTLGYAAGEKGQAPARKGNNITYVD